MHPSARKATELGTYARSGVADQAPASHGAGRTEQSRQRCAIRGEPAEFLPGVLRRPCHLRPVVQRPGRVSCDQEGVHRAPPTTVAGLDPGWVVRPCIVGPITTPRCGIRIWTQRPRRSSSSGPKRQQGGRNRGFDAANWVRCAARAPGVVHRGHCRSRLVARCRPPRPAGQPHPRFGDALSRRQGRPVPARTGTSACSARRWLGRPLATITPATSFDHHPSCT